MKNTLKNKFRNSKGASLVEAALLVALIAIVAIPSIRALGTRTGVSLQSTATQIENLNQTGLGGGSCPAGQTWVGGSCM